MEIFILTTIENISKLSGLKPDSFNINYRNSGKTLRTFKRSFKKHKTKVYSSLTFNSTKSDTFFKISNFVLNYFEKPEKSSIDFMFRVSSDLLDSNQVQHIAESLVNISDLDYGYITSLGLQSLALE
jgi:HSP90 family molecular chaperone